MTYLENTYLNRNRLSNYTFNKCLLFVCSSGIAKPCWAMLNMVLIWSIWFDPYAQIKNHVNKTPYRGGLNMVWYRNEMIVSTLNLIW